MRRSTGIGTRARRRKKAHQGVLPRRNIYSEHGSRRYLTIEVSTTYIIEVETAYVTRLFQYPGSEPPTERQIQFSHGEEAANDIEAIHVYPLDELTQLRLPPESVASATEAVSQDGRDFQNYSVYVDQVEVTAAFLAKNSFQKC